MKTCKHCGTRITAYEFFEGNIIWYHRGTLSETVTARWCWKDGDWFKAEPEDPEDLPLHLTEEE